ncbi:IS3 family transposase [Slackia exigua]|uniref:IS3 family transposase n=1 Tax=Slackia exigua TaxID=84109 RepID=UPI0034CF2EFF
MASGRRWAPSRRRRITPSLNRLWFCVKSECVHARTFDSRSSQALEIFDYIEGFYNPKRIYSALGWLSLDEFERVDWKGRMQAK